MKGEVIKPKKDKEYNDNKSLLTPILYLVIGFVLIFKSDEAIELFFYIIGIVIIIYGIKALINYFKTKDNLPFKNINLSIAVISFVIGLLLILLAGVLNLSIRYLIGFFLIFMGVSRLITELSYGKFFRLSVISNVVLIILGVYSVFVSHAVLVIIGVLLILNATILLIEYFKEK